MVRYVARTGMGGGGLVEGGVPMEKEGESGRGAVLLEKNFRIHTCMTVYRSLSVWKWVVVKVAQDLNKDEVSTVHTVQEHRRLD